MNIAGSNLTEFNYSSGEAKLTISYKNESPLNNLMMLIKLPKVSNASNLISEATVKKVNELMFFFESITGSLTTQRVGLAIPTERISLDDSPFYQHTKHAIVKIVALALKMPKEKWDELDIHLLGNEISSPCTSQQWETIATDQGTFSLSTENKSINVVADMATIQFLGASYKIETGNDLVVFNRGRLSNNTREVKLKYCSCQPDDQDKFFEQVRWIIAKLTINESSHIADKMLSMVDQLDCARVKSASLSDTDIRNSFHSFISNDLENEIFPYYEKHEHTFDRGRCHGRMHIGRCIIFSEIIARYFYAEGKPIDFDYVRRATAMHDAGRQDNGTDKWEDHSSKMLEEHLISKNMPTEEATKKSLIVQKQQADQSSLEFIAFQSADCLDIIRIFIEEEKYAICKPKGAKKRSFDSKLLTFLKDTVIPKENIFRNKLIDEAHIFVTATEDLREKPEFNENKGFMENLINIIRNKQNELPILSTIL